MCSSRLLKWSIILPGWLISDSYQLKVDYPRSGPVGPSRPIQHCCATLCNNRTCFRGTLCSQDHCAKADYGCWHLSGDSRHVATLSYFSVTQNGCTSALLFLAPRRRVTPSKWCVIVWGENIHFTLHRTSIFKTKVEKCANDNCLDPMTSNYCSTNAALLGTLRWPSFLDGVVYPNLFCTLVTYPFHNTCLATNGSYNVYIGSAHLSVTIIDFTGLFSRSWRSSLGDVMA